MGAGLSRWRGWWTNSLSTNTTARMNASGTSKAAGISWRAIEMMRASVRRPLTSMKRRRPIAGTRVSMPRPRTFDAGEISETCRSGYGYSAFLRGQCCRPACRTGGVRDGRCAAGAAPVPGRTHRTDMGRAPEQTRPRLFLRSRAPREADDSPDEADAAPRAQHSSIRHHDALHRDRSDGPSYGSSAHNTRTRVPAPPPNGPSGPARPSGAGTPAHTVDVSLPLRTPPLHSLKVSTKAGQLHPICSDPGATSTTSASSTSASTSTSSASNRRGSSPVAPFRSAPGSSGRGCSC